MRWKARKMLSVGLGFGLVLAGVGAAALWMHEHPNTSRAFPARAWHQAADPAKRIMPADIEALKAEIERLKADKKGLARLSDEMKSELTSLRSRLTQVERDQESIGRAPLGDEKADAPALTPEEELERAEAQTQAQVELIEGTMLTQKTDPEWANTAQLALHEVFQSEATAGILLMNAECRTTLCRMELVLDGSVSPEDSFRKLTHLAPWQGQGFVRIDPEGGSAVVYLSREGDSLPQLIE